MRPVPRSMVGRLSPISPGSLPRKSPAATQPQHLTVPPSRTARPVCDHPDAIATAVPPALARAEVDCWEVVAHFVGVVATLLGVSVAARGAPALDGVVVEQHAGVAGPSGHRDGAVPGAEVDGGQGVAHLAGAVAAAVGVALAELAASVPAPALHLARLDDRAGVLATGRDHGGGAAGRAGHRTGDGVRRHRCRGDGGQQGGHHRSQHHHPAEGTSPLEPSHSLSAPGARTEPPVRLLPRPGSGTLGG